jgi:cytosine/adenosine deaminase-related metal-dependent hydrolase
MLDPDRPCQWRAAMDIGIEHGRITLVAPSGSAAPETGRWDRTLDGTSRLIMPGLINAHCHSYESFTRGMIVNRPGGLWALYGHPVIGVGLQDARAIYVRTAAAAIEMVRRGITTVFDDVSLFFDYRIELVEAVLRAYRDVGLRALVAIKVMDKRLENTLPLTDVPPEWAQALAAVRVPSTDEAIDFSRACFQLSRPDDRVRGGVTPSAPQRSTDSLLRAQFDLASRATFPFFIHVQETRLQWKQGPALYGHSMIMHLDRLGVLAPPAGIIHGVWLDHADIDVLARSGASVIHNPVSNLRLGSGIAPVRRLLQAGVNVMLGSDGTASSDALCILDAMKVAALLPSIARPEYEDWLTPVEAYRLATRNTGLFAYNGEVGTIATGLKADLVMLNSRSPGFRPMNLPINQLVYCAPCIDIETVIADGSILMHDGRIETVDEDAIVCEFGELARGYRETIDKTFAIARRLEPHWRRMYMKLADDEPAISPAFERP